MKILSLTEFQNLASQGGNVIPVRKTLLADLLTPVSAFLKIRQKSQYAFLLESVEGGEKTARYSFLGKDPFLTLRYSHGTIRLEQAGDVQQFQGNLFDEIRKIMRHYHPVYIEGFPRFTGGAVGYFGYDVVRLLEQLPTATSDDLQQDEAVLMFFDTILVFDHLKHEISIIANAICQTEQKDLKPLYIKAIDKIEQLENSLRYEVRWGPGFKKSEGKIQSNFCKEDFCKAVHHAKEYIRAGDIFQVVLSQRFQTQISVYPFDIYRALRAINPSPYLYYLQMGDTNIIGSSPELMVRVENGIVEVRPIAGTRKRGANEAEDQQLAEELRADEKECAEHIMLVDLGRNDVGRVSQYGTVEVPEFMQIEKYSHVMHLVSSVRGRLRPELDSLDALTACFPAGTVTGAPKVRAMEIIEELEPTKRGIYAGALGYIDFSGNLDSCITIRTIVTQGDQAYFQAGAGIVADSKPEREFQETLEKSKALREAILLAERGLE
ncbi:anthranilate synthase component I [candidate division KSB1 bacterium]|nr:MAG: anthranilate synthase component I [candidate division KSB1 bacterium]RKY78283.1 MAG: anthranilate synthase component I [candidate division KSB1 bacterium]RKY86421.1 MAG: anthranilate synthase component I [candidate division KSB1 bacterium]